jgi:Tfp pilus assembly protein PilV
MTTRSTNARARRFGSRGYTVVEVIMAMSLFAVSSVGIVALQKVTTVSNMRAKNLSVANQIARTWVERLRSDASVWNYPSPTQITTVSDIGETVWLKNVATTGWFFPKTTAVTNGYVYDGAAFDAFGNGIPSNDVTATEAAPFCTQLRLSWIYPNELIRADIRVFWTREGNAGPFDGKPLCSANTDITRFDLPDGDALSRYHFVYVSTSVRKNTAQ